MYQLLYIQCNSNFKQNQIKQNTKTNKNGVDKGKLRTKNEWGVKGGGGMVRGYLIRI